MNVLYKICCKIFTEQCIKRVCENIRKSDIIDDGECIRVSLMLSKYFLARHIKLTIHYGFINCIVPDNGEHVVVLGSHMWLSYNNKKIDLTADKQAAPSTSYILDKPIEEIDSPCYIKAYHKATEEEKKETKKIINSQNDDLLTKFYQSAIASKAQNSSIEYSLLKEYAKNAGKKIDEETQEIILEGEDLFEEEYKKFEAIANG